MAFDNNAAIQESMHRSARAAREQQKQIVDQAAVERQKRVNEAQMISGRLRVAAAEAGVGLGGSYAALQRQSDYDAAINVDIIKRNALAETRRVRSGYEENIAQLESQIQNPILNGFMAGMQIASTALSITDSVGSIAKGFAKPQMTLTTTKAGP